MSGDFSKTDGLKETYNDIYSAKTGETKNIEGVGGPGQVAAVSARTGGYCEVTYQTWTSAGCTGTASWTHKHVSYFNICE